MEDSEKITLVKAHNVFKEALEAKKLSPATILAYSTDIKQLIKFLGKDNISQVYQVKNQNLRDFQKFLMGKGYQAVSCARKLNAIRTFFEFLKKKGFIKNNPVIGINTPKFAKSTPRILSKMEYRALRDTCRSNARTAALIEIFLQTGLKVSEVASLQIQDINKDKLFIRKNNVVYRDIPLTPSARKAIEKYLKERPQAKINNLFVTKNGTPLLIRNMSTILMRCFAQAEIKNASLNALRHTWIYNQLLAGIPLQVVSVLAGHKRVSTAARYLYFVDKKKLPARTKLVEL